MEPYFECVCAELCIDKETNFIATVYRPPKGNLSDFFHVLEQLLNFIEGKNYTNYYFLGDWNIDLLKVKINDTGVLDFLNLMYSHGFFPLTTKPTRVTDTAATLIDHKLFGQHTQGSGILSCSVL